MFGVDVKELEKGNTSPTPPTLEQTPKEETPIVPITDTLNAKPHVSESSDKTPQKEIKSKPNYTKMIIIAVVVIAVVTTGVIIYKKRKNG